MSKHVVVWIDHKEARTFHIAADILSATATVDVETIAAPKHNTHHKHPKGAAELKEHPDDTKRFFHDIVQALAGSEQILVVGPGPAKLEFVRYVHNHDHALESKIVGVETVDHPSDRQLVAYAKSYFKASDRMR